MTSRTKAAYLRLIKTESARRAEKGRHADGGCSHAPDSGVSGEITITLDDLARGSSADDRRRAQGRGGEYVAWFDDDLDEDGHRLVVRNGRARERKVTVGSGTVPVRAPRVNDERVDEETGERQRFSSKILPAYARRSPKVTEVLPILYLRGL